MLDPWRGKSSLFEDQGPIIHYLDTLPEREARGGKEAPATLT
jgi:hypothetical protein